MNNENDFKEFPKLEQSLTCGAFIPYLLYGRSETKEEKNTDPRAKRSSRNSAAKLGGQKQGEAQRIREGLSSTQIRDGRKVEGRGRKGCRAQGVDGRTEIKALHGLRRMLPGMLYGLRSPQGRQEGIQHRKHVRASLQPRTYSNRVGQMRLGLFQLPQNTNP
jgi:hypothetical protein